VKSLTAILSAGALLLGASVSDASKFYIDVSGGNGSPFTLTFANDITFVATADASDATENILIEGLTTATLMDGGSGSGLSNTINGTPYSLPDFITQSTFLVLYNDLGGYTGTIVAGDTIVLKAGTYASDSSVSFALNGSGYYTLELVDSSMGIISTTATSVPESAQYASVLGLAAFGALFMRRREKN
jgi:hypothetical protein